MQFKTLSTQSAASSNAANQAIASESVPASYLAAGFRFVFNTRGNQTHFALASTLVSG